MAGTQTDSAVGEGKVQTTNPMGSENCSGMHNPKVAGSNPVPATGNRRTHVFGGFVPSHIMAT